MCNFYLNSNLKRFFELTVSFLIKNINKANQINKF